MTDVRPVHLCLDLRDPASQVLTVVQSWTPSTLQQRWQMPVWTPGSYTVRDPSQHLHGLTVHQGDELLSPRRLSPSNWSVQLTSLEPIQLRYQLEARQLTVRTSHLDPSFASLCLSAVVMEIEGQRWNPHTLELLLPDGWKGFVPLPQCNGLFVSEDFDQLVDSPVHAGAFEATEFIVQGCTHTLLLIGEPPMGWSDSLVADIEAVCCAAAELMGGPPPAGNRYQLVIQLLESGYGGLEHDHGAVLQFSWPTLAKPDGYHQLLQLVGHEYLHQWNVRRLRPLEYRPYDYGQPVISDGLWFAEGITSYYDLTLTLLAGRSTRTMLLKDLGKDLSHALLHPGGSVQSLADSSREAWVRLYKATPAGLDTQISYYKLGTALAFCLDVQLRQRGASLAQVLRLLWEQFGTVGRGYSRRDIQAALATVDPYLSRQLPQWLDQTDSLPIQRCVEMLGLSLVPVPGTARWTGLTLEELPQGVRITRVRLGSPGHHAGLVAGDELVAVQGHRLRSLEQWPLLLKGDGAITVHLARRGWMEETRLIPTSPLTEAMTLEWNTQASQESKALRDQWFAIL